jgi:hypothetical protein
MRRLADADRIRRFLAELGRVAPQPARLYLVGGATAVLEGWRDSTVDIDIEIEPESDALLRAIPALKTSLEVNVELAAPHHFIPELPGWRERSRFVEQIGNLTVLHYDPYAQALAKIERRHAQDVEDVRRMLDEGLVDAEELRRHFAAIEPALYRYPALDAASFRRALDEVLRGAAS